MRMVIALFSFLMIVACAIPSVSQQAVNPPQSPMAVATMRYHDVYVKVVYSRPLKRGRQIFGSLVPYGAVWQLGANEATEITLTRDLIVNGFNLNAGTYSMFAIPEPDHWTVIFNADLGMWGSYNYNPAMDVTRVVVPVKDIPDAVYEPFTMKFDQHNDKADLLILWDRTSVRIPFEFITSHP